VSLLKQKKDKEMMIQNSAVHFTSIIIKDIVDQEVLNLATAEVRLGEIIEWLVIFFSVK
jgi:hypothetical protein